MNRERVERIVGAVCEPPKKGTSPKYSKNATATSTRNKNIYKFGRFTDQVIDQGKNMNYMSKKRRNIDTYKRYVDGIDIKCLFGTQFCKLSNITSYNVPCVTQLQRKNICVAKNAKFVTQTGFNMVKL